ncbi:DUF6318 family protein [Sanguibacter suaedae]|uniref:DUF6318 domain-containing protein n=1 Tax=Sanguibacter suaedae TaxID=2795737 RepID=A0A934I7N6_9MICO|nr:DUF6318 family protein [Sanguibacter suaedae]MBI9113497.1 hypothetical protein [Sanguibacter suaedae]
MSVHSRTMRPDRRSAGWALLTTAVLVLAGCADDPAATPRDADAATTSTETAPATPKPTEDPAPTPPERPAAMNGTDDEAAKAAAIYFLELYEYTLQTRELAKWDAISDPACSFCANVRDKVIADEAKSLVSSGIRITWGDEISVSRPQGPTLVKAIFLLSQDASTTVDSKGDVTDTFAAVEYEVAVYVHRDTDWLLYGLAKVE